MTTTPTGAEELRNDLDNLLFTKRYLIGVLAELEDIGRTNSWDFQRTEMNLKTINNNIRCIEAELEKVEAHEFEEEVDPYYFSDGMHW